jgi:hypothetical protein
MPSIPAIRARRDDGLLLPKPDAVKARRPADAAAARGPLTFGRNETLTVNIVPPITLTAVHRVS